MSVVNASTKHNTRVLRDRSNRDTDQSTNRFVSTASLKLTSKPTTKRRSTDTKDIKKVKVEEKNLENNKKSSNPQIESGIRHVSRSKVNIVSVTSKKPNKTSADGVLERCSGGAWSRPKHVNETTYFHKREIKNLETAVSAGVNDQRPARRSINSGGSGYSLDIARDVQRLGKSSVRRSTGHKQLSDVTNYHTKTAKKAKSTCQDVIVGNSSRSVQVGGLSAPEKHTSTQKCVINPPQPLPNIDGHRNIGEQKGKLKIKDRTRQRVKNQDVRNSDGLTSVEKGSVSITRRNKLVSRVSVDAMQRERDTRVSISNVSAPDSVDVYDDTLGDAQQAVTDVKPSSNVSTLRSKPVKFHNSKSNLKQNRNALHSSGIPKPICKPRKQITHVVDSGDKIGNDREKTNRGKSVENNVNCQSDLSNAQKETENADNGTNSNYFNSVDSTTSNSKCSNITDNEINEDLVNISYSDSKTIDSQDTSQEHSSNSIQLSGTEISQATANEPDVPGNKRAITREHLSRRKSREINEHRIRYREERSPSFLHWRSFSFPEDLKDEVADDLCSYRGTSLKRTLDDGIRKLYQSDSDLDLTTSSGCSNNGNIKATNVTLGASSIHKQGNALVQRVNSTCDPSYSHAPSRVRPENQKLSKKSDNENLRHNKQNRISHESLHLNDKLTRDALKLGNSLNKATRDTREVGTQNTEQEGASDVCQTTQISTGNSRHTGTALPDNDITVFYRNGDALKSNLDQVTHGDIKNTHKETFGQNCALLDNACEPSDSITRVRNDTNGQLSSDTSTQGNYYIIGANQACVRSNDSSHYISQRDLLYEGFKLTQVSCREVPVSEFISQSNPTSKDSSSFSSLTSYDTDRSDAIELSKGDPSYVINNSNTTFARESPVSDGGLESLKLSLPIQSTCFGGSGGQHNEAGDDGTGLKDVNRETACLIQERNLQGEIGEDPVLHEGDYQSRRSSGPDDGNDEVSVFSSKMNKTITSQHTGKKTKDSPQISSSLINNAAVQKTDKIKSSKQIHCKPSSDRTLGKGGTDGVTPGNRNAQRRGAKLRAEIGEKVELQSHGVLDYGLNDSKPSKKINNGAANKLAYQKKSTASKTLSSANENTRHSTGKITTKNGTASKQTREANDEDMHRKHAGNSFSSLPLSRLQGDRVIDNVKKRCKTFTKTQDKNIHVISDGTGVTVPQRDVNSPISINGNNLTAEVTVDGQIDTPHCILQRHKKEILSHVKKVNKITGKTTGFANVSITRVTKCKRVGIQLDQDTRAKTRISSADNHNTSTTFTKTRTSSARPKSVGSIQHQGKTKEVPSVGESYSEQDCCKSSVTLSTADEQHGHTYDLRSIFLEQKHQDKASLHSISNPENAESSQIYARDVDLEQGKFVNVQHGHDDTPLTYSTETSCNQLTAINFLSTSAVNSSTDDRALCLRGSDKSDDTELDRNKSTVICDCLSPRVNSESNVEHVCITSSDHSTSTERGITEQYRTSADHGPQHLLHVPCLSLGDTKTISQSVPGPEYIENHHNDESTDGYSQHRSKQNENIVCGSELQRVDSVICYPHTQCDTYQDSLTVLCSNDARLRKNDMDVMTFQTNQKSSSSSCSVDNNEEAYIDYNEIIDERYNNNNNDAQNCADFMGFDTNSNDNDLVNGYESRVRGVAYDNDWNRNSALITACNSKVMNNYDNGATPGVDIGNVQDNDINLHKHYSAIRPGGAQDGVPNQNQIRSITGERKMYDHECDNDLGIGNNVCSIGHSDIKGDVGFLGLYAEVDCVTSGKHDEQGDTPLSQDGELKTSRSSIDGFNSCGECESSENDNLVEKIHRNDSQHSAEEFNKKTSSNTKLPGRDSIMSRDKKVRLDNTQSKDVRSLSIRKKQGIPQATKLQKIRSPSHHSAASRDGSTQRHSSKKQINVKENKMRYGAKTKQASVVTVSSDKMMKKEKSVSRESSPTHSVKSDDTWTSCSTTGTKRLSVGSKDSSDSKLSLSVKEKKESCDTKNLKAKRTDIKVSEKTSKGKKKISDGLHLERKMVVGEKKTANVSNRSIPTRRVNNPKNETISSAKTSDSNEKSSRLVKPRSIQSHSISKTSTSKLSTQFKKKETKKSDVIQKSEGDSFDDDLSANQLSTRAESCVSPEEESSTPVSPTRARAASTRTLRQPSTLANNLKPPARPIGYLNLKQKTTDKTLSPKMQKKFSSNSNLIKKTNFKQSNVEKLVSPGCKLNDLDSPTGSSLANGISRKSGIPSPVSHIGIPLVRKQKLNNKDGVEIRKPPQSPDVETKQSKNITSTKSKVEGKPHQKLSFSSGQASTRSKTVINQDSRRGSKEGTPENVRSTSSSTPSDRNSVVNNRLQKPSSILKLVRSKTESDKQNSRLSKQKSAVPKLSKTRHKDKTGVMDNTPEVCILDDDKKIGNDTDKSRSKKFENCDEFTQNYECINNYTGEQTTVSKLPVSESFENSSGVDSPFVTPPESNKQFGMNGNVDSKNYSMENKMKSTGYRTHSNDSEVSQADDIQCSKEHGTLDRRETQTFTQHDSSRGSFSKVLKCDITDQDSVITKPVCVTHRTACQQNIILDTESTNPEQLSQNAFHGSQISAIETYNRDLMHMQVVTEPGRHESINSESGSSDDYWSVTDEDNDKNGDGLSGERISVTPEKLSVSLKSNSEDKFRNTIVPENRDIYEGCRYNDAGGGGNINTFPKCEKQIPEKTNDSSGTAEFITTAETYLECQKTFEDGVDVTPKDSKIKTDIDNNSSKNIPTQKIEENESAQRYVLSRVHSQADDQIQQIKTEITDDKELNEMRLHSQPKEKKSEEDYLFSKNTPSFDLKHEIITHPEKSDLDMETVLINSFESSKTEENCAIDKTQYVSTDYEEKLPEPANLGEYFDDGIDKLEKQGIELNKGDTESVKCIKLSGGSNQPTEEALRGSMDNVPHLSFSQNILTLQNKQDVLCSHSNTKHTQHGSSLLTSEYPNQREVSHYGSDRGTDHDDHVIVDRNVIDDEEINLIISDDNGIYKNSDVTNSVIECEVSDGDSSLRNTKTVDIDFSGTQTDTNEIDGILDGTHRAGGNICQNNGNYDEQNISGENESDEMNGHMGIYQANMAAKTLKPEEARETSRQTVGPTGAITRRETSIRYEIVTTTITKHKKCETKTTEVCSSDASTADVCDCAMLHEKKITEPSEVCNTHSLKFESKEVKFSSSNSRSNVYSHLPIRDSQDVNESSNTGCDSTAGNFDINTTNIDKKRGYHSRPGSAIDNELLNDNNQQAIEESRYEYNACVSSAINSGLNSNNPGSLIPQQGNNSSFIGGSPDIEENGTQQLKVHGAEVSGSASISPQKFNQVIWGEQRDNADRDVSDESNKNTTGSNWITAKETQNQKCTSEYDDATVYDLDKNNGNIYRMDEQRSNLSKRGITLVDSGKESFDSRVQNQGLRDPDYQNQAVMRLLTSNSTGISTRSSTANTSNTENIYENKMRNTDNTLDNHESLQNSTETPKVALLVTRNQSESDNSEENSDPDTNDNKSLKTSETLDKYENTTLAGWNEHESEYSQGNGNGKDSQNAVVDSVSLLKSLPEPEQVTDILEENVFTVTLPAPLSNVSVSIETSLSTADYNDNNTADTEASFNIDALNSSNDTLPDIVQTINLSNVCDHDIADDISTSETTNNELPLDCQIVPKICVSSKEEETVAPSESKQPKQKNNDLESSSNKPYRRDIDRKNIRRFTATVCLVDKSKDDAESSTNMSPPSRPRARSKSPVELRNTGSVPESKQQVSVFGSGRVSDICKSFIQKTRTKGKSIADEPPSSPLSQSPSPTRKQKWLRDNGVWKKVSLEEYERIMAAKISASALPSDCASNTSADDEKEKENALQDGDIKHITDFSKTSEVRNEQPGTPKLQLKSQRDNTTLAKLDIMAASEAWSTPVVKTPPKTLPKPKFRKKSRENMLTEPRSNTSQEGVNSTVDVGHCPGKLETSFDADKTLTTEEETPSKLDKKNDNSEKVTDSLTEKHDNKTDVQIAHDNTEQNVYLNRDNSNLSNTCIPSVPQPSAAEITRPEIDLSNVTCNTFDMINTSNSDIGVEDKICDSQFVMKVKRDDDENSHATNLKSTNTSGCSEQSNDDTSPQDNLSFAEKLKKAENRFGKLSGNAVLDSKEIFKPRRKERVTLRPLNKNHNDSKVNQVTTATKPKLESPTKENNTFIAPAFITRSPQKLRAVKIKQEIFPKEEPVTIQTHKLTAVKISQETFPKEEPKPEVLETEISGSNSSLDVQQQQPEVDKLGSPRRTRDRKRGTGVKFYVGDDDSNICDSQKNATDIEGDFSSESGNDTDCRSFHDTQTRVQNPANPNIVGHSGENNIWDLTYQRRDLPRGHGKPDGEGEGHAVSRRMLLSEIVELEESNGNRNCSTRLDEDKVNGNTWHKSSSTADRMQNRSPIPVPRTYNRSHSLPAGTLNYSGNRIVYKDGHFVIETGYDSCDQSSVDLHGDEEAEQQDNASFTYSQQNRSTNKDNNTISDHNRKNIKRISYSEPHLCDTDDYDEVENISDYDADVFLQNDGDVTVISNDSYESTNQKPPVPLRSKPIRETRIPRPLSVDENQLFALQNEASDKDQTMKQLRKSVRDAKARRSKSFKEVSDRIDDVGKLKRNSSFKEAQEKGPVSMSPRDSSLRRSDSTGSSKEELRPKSPGFLQKLLFKRKSFSEKGAKPGDASSRDSFMKKMSIKGLFKKEKQDTSISKSDEPPSPPIAAFQGDLDIHAVDSAPNSPFSNAKFRRRHTSADIYFPNQSHTVINVKNVRRTSESKPGPRDDQTGVKTYIGLDHPKRPISPKPSSVSITRRNSNLSLPSSPLKESPFELTINNSPNRLDTDSISSCSINSSNMDSSSLVSATSVTNASFCDNSDLGQRANLSKQSSVSSSIISPSSQDLDKLSTLVQGGEMTSSNSNDSGIQNDVSAHSSSESLKTHSHDSASSVVRRRKSPSPHPERPKSEISVRWADLVETNEITPVKRRESSQRNKPRPKSDIGGSSLKSDMQPFGSEVSLQPYSSLQSLDSLRMRQEAMDQKPNKRRMSTPQPIKTRLDRAPLKRRVRKTSTNLVRSHSMPESLDKLYRRKRLMNMLGSSNLHCDDYLGHMDEDSSSDDGSEFSLERISLNEKCNSTRSSQAGLSTLSEMPEGENLTYAEALWDHITMDPEELGFHAGDVIEIMDMADKDWWWGAIDDREGWFPATFVRLRVNQERFEEDIVPQTEITHNLSPNLRRVSVINKDQARENVVNEIISAERDYVKHLKDVVEGYIKHARKRQDMFSEDRINVMFGNIEEIYLFSNKFLQSLDDAFDADSPHLSELGHCFLLHSKEFEIYSDYCNNHPSASEELRDLYRKQKYRHFFEACRLLQEMIEIPLEGFLLTPVQKICKYPLQLAELLKFTSPTHPDFTNVQAALQEMKKIAALINERKRKMESIEKLARWQHTVEDWHGPDLLEKSSELILSGEFNKINSAGWSQERYFFLFDHQMIYCKKDLLKKNGFSYKGRVDLDQCELTPVDDGKDPQYNVTVKNAWKIHETIRDKWYLLYTKTPAEKQRWLRAFQKERERVWEDQENDFVPSHWKKTVLNKLRANKVKEFTTRNVPVQYQKDFIRGIPSHATLPRSYGKKMKDKKKAWSLFGNKKTK